MTNPVIFLDIDGVLNHHSDSGEACREPDLFPLRIGKIQNLRFLLSRVDGRVVISSSWRTRMRDNPVLCPVRRALLRCGLDTNLIIGRTGEHGTRGELILDWVRVHRAEKWVVLDDQAHDFRNHLEIKNRFIHVNPEKGLNDVDIQGALAILNRI